MQNDDIFWREEMLHPDLLEILRCPACAKENKGELDYYKESWLICKDCGRKYPVVDDIPVMLIDEGAICKDFCEALC